MQSHFICTECGSSSLLNGTCQNESCIRQGERLKECRCEDNKHEGLLASLSESSDPNSLNSERQDGFTINTIDLDSTDSL